jgi:hypothetical protein
MAGRDGEPDGVVALRARLELVEVGLGHLLELLGEALRLSDLRPERNGPLHWCAAVLKR